MTANPRRRRRRTWLALIFSFLLLGGAIALTALGISTLRHSQEGEAVGIDERPVVTLPTTANALVVATDPDGNLASMVIATLLPAGRGGTIVTLPAHADINGGWTLEPVTLVEAFDDVDPDDAAGLDAFVAAVESMLSISVERTAVVGADELAVLLETVAPADVTLPDDIVVDGEVVLEVGQGELSALQAATVLTAVPAPADDADGDGVTIAQADLVHAADVAVWSGLGAEAPVPVSETLPTDTDGAVVAPAGVDELFERLWQGPVQVRDLLIDVDTDLPSGDDPVVVVDRRDSLLVFAQISPKLVSTPNQALSFRLEIGFTDEELAESVDGYASNTEVGRELIGALLFFQANVVSVDASTNDGSTPTVTRVSVADEQFLDDMEEFSPILFGESEVVLADTRIEGVDVVVEVGTDFLATSRQDTEVVVVEDGAAAPGTDVASETDADSESDTAEDGADGDEADP